MYPKDPNAEWIEVIKEEIPPYSNKKEIIELIRERGREEEYEC